MRFALILFVLLLTSVVQAEDKGFDSKTAAARQAAADGKLADAIGGYQALLKSLPKGDARAEMISAELIMVYYAQKDNQKTARESIKFLQTFPQSQFGFNISYILAAAYFGMDRYNDAFTIFASFPFEAVRSLPEDSKGKVYEVLIRSLSGMKQEPASLALRADVNNLLVTADGRPLLTGPVSEITTLLKTDEDLNRLIEQAPTSERERIYALLNRQPPSNAGEPFVPVFTAGVGLSSDTIVNPAYGQMMSQLFLGVELPLTPDGSGIGLKTAIDLFNVSTDIAGTGTNQLKVDLLVKGRMFGDGKKGLLMNLIFGLHYRTASVTGTAIGFRDILGLYLYPEFRYHVDPQMSFALYAMYAPLAKMKGQLSAFNQLWSFGVDFSFKGLGHLANSVFIDFERFRFRASEVVSSAEIMRLGFGYRVQF